MIVERLLEFLNKEAEAIGLPTVMLDCLMLEDAVGLMTETEPSTEKEYIDGSRIKRFAFRLTRHGRANATNSLANLGFLEELEAFATLFRLMEDFEFHVSQDRLVVYRDAMVTWRDQFVAFGYDESEFPLGSDTFIIKAETSTPSILAREENGMVTYGITINLLYKEN